MKTLFYMIIIALHIQADTIHFKNGAILEGKITNQDVNLVTIEIEGHQTHYARQDIKSVSLDKVVSTPPPPPPVQTTKVNKSELILPVGTTIHIRTLQQLDSKNNAQGDQFMVELETSLTNSTGVVIVPKGSKLYGKVLQVEEARRIIGESKMIITLTDISLHDKRIPITTSSLNILSGENEGRDSARKMLRGAAIGAMINGNEGARDGVKVGAGVALLTRGKPTGISTNALLDFKLQTAVTIQVQ